jgi:ketosteroid isomerase-like protein
MWSDQIVRKPLAVRDRSSRTLDERLALRFPRLADMGARGLDRLPPRSRLRQAIVWRAARLSLEAFNRRDLDAFQLLRHPDWEFHPGREFVEAGLTEPCYRGAAGYRQYVSSLDEVWGADILVEPLELIELGDRFVLLANVPARGQASGVQLRQNAAWVLTVTDAQVSRQQEYLDHAEALSAVGLCQ